MTLCIVGSNGLPTANGYANIRRSASEVTMTPTVLQPPLLSIPNETSFHGPAGIHALPPEPLISRIAYPTALNNTQEDTTSIAAAVLQDIRGPKIIVGLSQPHTAERALDDQSPSRPPIRDDDDDDDSHHPATSIPAAAAAARAARAASRDVSTPIRQALTPVSVSSASAAARTSVAVNLLALLGAGLLWFGLLAQMISI